MQVIVIPFMDLLNALMVEHLGHCGRQEAAKCVSYIPPTTTVDSLPRSHSAFLKQCQIPPEKALTSKGSLPLQMTTASALL